MGGYQAGLWTTTTPSNQVLVAQGLALVDDRSRRSTNDAARDQFSVADIAPDRVDVTLHPMGQFRGGVFGLIEDSDFGGVEGLVLRSCHMGVIVTIITEFVAD